MLILFNGMQTLLKKFIVRNIISDLNRFEYMGYKCDLSTDNFKIYNYRDELVFSGNEEIQQNLFLLTNEDGSKSEEGFDVFKHFEKQNDLLAYHVSVNHFSGAFDSLNYEYGIDALPKYQYEESLHLHPSTIDDAINNVKNSKYKHNVISGYFSNTFVKEIKEAFPNEEVIVLNIIRNPSVSWFLNKKPKTKYRTNLTPDLTEETDVFRFYDSMLSAIQLMKDPEVITIRFEDMMRDGFFYIKDNKITLNEDFKLFNDYINIGESELKVRMSKSELEQFNQRISEFTPKKYLFFDTMTDEEIDNEYNEYKRTDEFKAIGKDFKDINEIYDVLDQKLPKNIFKELNYEPVSFTEIIKNKK